MAIKVSGTSVIDDSRALKNIASVDAATATAITAAGVGGAPDLSGGVGSSGILITGSGAVLPPVGAVLLVDVGSSLINSNILGYQKYGIQKTMNTSSNILKFYSGTGSGYNYQFITSGTWRLLTSVVHDASRYAVIVQRIA